MKVVVPLLRQLVDWEKNGVFVSLAALNAIDSLGPRAASIADAVLALPNKGPSPDARYSSYVLRLLEHIPQSVRK